MCRTAFAGPGGNGGFVRTWTQAPSLILLQLVDSPAAPAIRTAPTVRSRTNPRPRASRFFSTGTVSFTTHSPDAEGYRVFASLAGAPAKLIMTTKVSGGALPKVAPCVKADYSLSAFSTAVGWQSDPIGPVTFMKPPSANQACTDAPQLTFGVRKLSKKIGALRKKKWRVKLRFLADGMGTAHVVLSRKGKKLVTADKLLAAVRREVTMTLTLPKKLRKPGKFAVTVTGSAPLGKARSKSTLTLEVKS